MANLSITQAWNETVEFVRREAGLLFPISFMLLALPRALAQAVTPPPPLPGQLPEPGLWLLLVPIIIVAGIVGNVAISYLALRPGSSVGEALRRGIARVPAFLVVAILLGIVFVILLFVVAVVAVLVVPGAMTAAQSGAEGPAMIRFLLVIGLILLPILLFFGARLMMITPAAAAESGGPFDLIGRSWTLTTGHTWKLIGFLVLVFIALIVIAGAIGAVAGLLFTFVTGPIRLGSTSAWLVIVTMSLVNMVITAYLTSLVARIYGQLSGGAPERVFT